MVWELAHSIWFGSQPVPFGLGTSPFHLVWEPVHSIWFGNQSIPFGLGASPLHLVWEPAHSINFGLGTSPFHLVWEPAHSIWFGNQSIPFGLGASPLHLVWEPVHSIWFGSQPTPFGLGTSLLIWFESTSYLMDSLFSKWLYIRGGQYVWRTSNVSNSAQNSPHKVNNHFTYHVSYYDIDGGGLQWKSTNVPTQNICLHPVA